MKPCSFYPIRPLRFLPFTRLPQVKAWSQSPVCERTWLHGDLSSLALTQRQPVPYYLRTTTCYLLPVTRKLSGTHTPRPPLHATRLSQRPLSRMRPYRGLRARVGRTQMARFRSISDRGRKPGEKCYLVRTDGSRSRAAAIPRPVNGKTKAYEKAVCAHCEVGTYWPVEQTWRPTKRDDGTEEEASGGRKLMSSPLVVHTYSVLAVLFCYVRNAARLRRHGSSRDTSDDIPVVM